MLVATASCMAVGLGYGDVWPAGELEAAVPEFRSRFAVVGLAMRPSGVGLVEDQFEGP